MQIRISMTCECIRDRVFTCTAADEEDIALFHKMEGECIAPLRQNPCKNLLKTHL